jgi:lysophospholipase L1-like esterase
MAAILRRPMRVPAHTWRARLGTLALLAAGCTAALVLLEVFLRLANPLGQRLRGDEIVLPTHTRHVLQNRDNPRLDPEIVIARNGLGFRGPDAPPDFESWLTLVAVGGSTTECRFLTEGRDWPAVLARILAPRFRRLWVDNAGLDGHSTYGHAVLVRQRLARLRPNVALFLVGVNDVERDDLKSQDRALTNRREENETVLTRLARWSAIAATVQNLGRAARAEQLRLGHLQVDLHTVPAREPDRARTERLVRRHRREYVHPFRERVFELVRLCRGRGIMPVLLTQPALYGPVLDPETGIDLGRVDVDPVRRWDGALAWAILEAYNDATREVAAAEGVPLVDLARDLPKSSRLFYDFHHFTNEGAAAVAERVAAVLCPELARRFPTHAEGACS